MKEGQIERHLTLGITRSLRITLQGKQGKTVIQIEFVCVTSSFFGGLLGGGLWETGGDGEGVRIQRDSHYFSHYWGINEGCQTD